MVRKHQRKAQPLLLAALVCLFIVSFSQTGQAQGGPPMLTDDPGTPGRGRWEINFLAAMDRSRAGWSFETPNVDLNYGLGERIQLKFEVPWLVKKDTGERTVGGPGSSMAGLKWRFLEDESHGLELSMYPQLEFNQPTRSVSKGLVDDGRRLFLPIEAVKRIGAFEINGEIGYRIVQHRTDEVEYGLLVARQATKRVELMAELHGSVLRSMREGELFFNAGSRVALAKNSVLLISAGRTIRSLPGEGPHYIAMIGIQLNLRRGIGGR